MLCCPVPLSKAPSGCYGCEIEGFNLVHPDTEDFYGHLAQHEGKIHLGLVHAIWLQQRRHCSSSLIGKPTY
ncbi:hypothetical protein DAI22_10g071900 [Oryza sativa Japonica Group]|nr:hypothetical protein DAI22_10g071900 [Oryza sativa Japonica Group]